MWLVQQGNEIEKIKIFSTEYYKYYRWQKGTVYVMLIVN